MSGSRRMKRESGCQAGRHPGIHAPLWLIPEYYPSPDYQSTDDLRNFADGRATSGIPGPRARTGRAAAVHAGPGPLPAVPGGRAIALPGQRHARPHGAQRPPGRDLDPGDRARADDPEGAGRHAANRPDHHGDPHRRPGTQGPCRPAAPSRRPARLPGLADRAGPNREDRGSCHPRRATALLPGPAHGRRATTTSRSAETTAAAEAVTPAGPGRGPGITAPATPVAPVRFHEPSYRAIWQAGT